MFLESVLADENNQLNANHLKILGRRKRTMPHPSPSLRGEEKHKRLGGGGGRIDELPKEGPFQTALTPIHSNL